jgi:hypothetical protein
MPKPLPDPIILNAKNQVEAIRRDREELIRQVRQSQETIERSQALIVRIDALLAKIDPEPKD